MRDWVCLYADAGSDERCRLDSHVVTFDSMHETRLAWNAGEKRRWVLARSTLPLGAGSILRGAGDARDGRDVFGLFLGSVQVRCLVYSEFIGV